MKLSEALQYIKIVNAHIPPSMSEYEFAAICHNSRLACEGSLFICKKGAVSDGHAYAGDAYDRGVRCFIAERELDLPQDAAVIIVNDANTEMCKLAVEFYGHPAEKLRIVGITGTKGKTTVALSIYSILTSSGVHAGYIGTNGAYYGGKVFETANTTPDCLELQRIFREMLISGVSTVIIEVSSQALWQSRIYGIRFESCIFTNLYEDHIGGHEHPDMDHYRACKKSLFTDYGAESIIVNADSPDWKYMTEGVTCPYIIKTSSEGKIDCDFYATDKIRLMNRMLPGVSFELNGTHDVFIPIPGEYSIENGLLCIAACVHLGLELEDVIRYLSRVSISGRFEALRLRSRPDSLFVIDYAHNGASLKAVLRSMREYSPRRIICVFGSVGERTYGRRAELAHAAKEGADVIIVTSDNPGNEDPWHVVEDIASYLDGCKREVYLIPDRKEALKKAYDIAQKGDFVLLAGKGHENYQLIGNQKVAFSEKEILFEFDRIGVNT